MRCGLDDLDLDQVTGLDLPGDGPATGDEIDDPMMRISATDLTRSVSTGPLHEHSRGRPNSSSVIVHREAPLEPLQSIEATAAFRPV